MKKTNLMSSECEKNYSVQSVENALSILETFCEINGEELSLGDLSGRLGLNKSMVFRLLATFQKRGYIEQVSSNKKYKLGLTAYEVSRKVLLRMKLLSVSKHHLIEFSRIYNETVYTCIKRSEDILMLDVVQSANVVNIKSLVGDSLDYDGNSAGNIFIANSKNLIESKVISESEISNILTSKISFDKDVFGENVTSFSVPIFNKSGEAIACLCLIGPSDRLEEKIKKTDIVEKFKQSGVIVSTRLGYMEDYKNFM